MKDETLPNDVEKTQQIQETMQLSDASDTCPEVGENSQPISGEFGRYQIEKTLGEGAMGAVYLAHDAQLNRKVALKIPKFSQGTDERVIKRFYQEARSAATLNHPNICSVYDVGQIEETHYIAMAYIQGQPLSEFVNPADPPSQRSITRVVRKIALALHEAHSQGVIHRDLKPANIMIDQRNEPIIMDFGLARQADQSDDARLTQDGTILGSPAYMSPEQLEGKPENIGPACDIYGLGVVFYELLTGELPFQGSGSIMSIIGEVFSKEPPNAVDVRSDLEPCLAALCTKAMAKKPGERFGSMKDFASELTNFLKSKGGDATTTQLRSPTESETKDPSLIRVEEQCKLARSLCQERQFAGAVSILEKMAEVTDPQAAKFVEWAKRELPKVQSLVASESVAIDLTAEQPLASSSSLFGEDVLNQEFAAPATTFNSQPFGTPLPQKSERSFPAWALWLIPIPIVAVLVIVGINIAGRFNNQNGQQSSIASTDTNSTTPTNSTAETESQSTEEQPGYPLPEPPGPPPPRPEDGPDFGPPRHAEQILEDLDLDQSGTITEDEIPQHDMIHFAFADINDDGAIDSDELRQQVRLGKPDAKRESRIELVVLRVMEKDKNQDGKISQEEMRPLMRHILRGGDKNGDLSLDEDEIRNSVIDSFHGGPGRGNRPREDPRPDGPFGPGRQDRPRN